MKSRISSRSHDNFLMSVRRSFSSLLDSSHRKLSLGTLLSLSVPHIIQQIALRSKLQYDHLDTYPQTRPLRILRSLYKDTVENIEVFQCTHAPERTQALGRLLKSQLESLDTRHGMVTETLADAFSSLNPLENGSNAQSKGPLQRMQQHLPSILRRQASISALLQHGVGLTSSRHFCATGCVVNSDIMLLCTGVKNQAVTIANHQFNWSPDIIISMGNDYSAPGILMNSQIICIPSFARFVLLEIFKNSLQATAELYLERNPCVLKASTSPDFEITAEDFEIPIVRVDIACSTECVKVTVRDEGSGMTAEELDRASEFLWASTIKVSSMVEAQASYQPMSEPFRGLGVGLCLSSIYASHFGGSLLVHSDGKNQGTTVTFIIPRDIDIVEKI